MRWLAFLSVLAACGAAPVRARDCPSSWVLVRAQGRCGDLRGGWSGYWVLVIVDGPHRGTTVIEPYGDSRGTSQVANWNIARVDLRPTTGATGWDNGCSQLTGRPTAGPSSPSRASRRRSRPGSRSPRSRAATSLAVAVVRAARGRARVRRPRRCCIPRRPRAGWPGCCRGRSDRCRPRPPRRR